MQFSSGFLLSLSLCLDIGVANIAMITLAMQRGFGAGLWLGLGTCVGDLAYAILALAGMTVLLQYTPVRWGLWLGGSALLIWFALRMLRAALASGSDLAPGAEAREQSPARAFGRGVFLAMSSPSAILWFAAVGGALISRADTSGPMGTGLFLGGFFSAGVLWCMALCGAASQGGKLLGARLLKFSYLASAAIFAWFAAFVITSGYDEFILGTVR